MLEENTVPALLLCPFTSTKIELPHLQLEWFFNQARQTYIRRKLIKILPLSSCSNIILSKSLMHKRSTMTQDSDPFLVWLPGQPDLAPRIQGPLFTGRAGLNHSVWGGPGLELVSLGPPHSGRYTCRLTSHAGRAEAWADMLVFSPHSELEFQQRRLSGGAGVRLSCRVAGTFPRPELRLTRGTETLQPDSATTTSTDRFAFSARVDKVGEVERAATVTAAASQPTERTAEQAAAACRRGPSTSASKFFIFPEDSSAEYIVFRLGSENTVHLLLNALDTNPFGLRHFYITESYRPVN